VTLFGRTWHYLGGSDLALQVIIWSIPIGFVNSVTQYVLIAVDQQRYLTRAFVFGVVFNIVGNLIAIPRFGYVGAAVVTILSEFSLLFPFYASVRRHIGRVPWFAIFRGPALAAGVMALAILWLNGVGVNVWLSAIVGGIVYLVALVPAGAFAGEEMAIVRRMLRIPRMVVGGDKWEGVR
jgi:O-antigen/teichoic acid export membrane protein